MINDIFRSFHIVIIAIIFLYFSGCGHKTMPIYKKIENKEIVKKKEGQ